jgi:hypothetical protein
MKILTLIFLIFALALTQTPPFWGGFPQYTVNITMLNNNPILKWNFTYYYDSVLKVERY